MSMLTVSLAVFASTLLPLRLLNHALTVYNPVLDGFHVVPEVSVPVEPLGMLMLDKLDVIGVEPFTL
ncbi:MAG: Uncharacterised protein [Flavobacteriales bacterium UBA4585]|nr:MAG: Uncharacterised protein [Flavobacteriales bacterium UBA4585]